MAAIFSLVMYSLHLATAMADNMPQVSLNNGSVVINGLRARVRKTKLDVYLGVPYAYPPVDDLRFRPPEAIEYDDDDDDVSNATEPSVSVIDATTLPPACIQMLEPNDTVSEDCLYLNIWTPSKQAQHPRAVMVWIHGGDFIAGKSSSDRYDGSKLAAENKVVVVTMQYRLSALGFLYLASLDAPGNMGLLDQQMALQWIHENIAAFGGDTERITIFGTGAGATSVNYHLLSVESRPYFNNAILQSGSALSDMAMTTHRAALYRAFSLAWALDCDPIAKRAQVIECLQAVDPIKLESTSWTLPNHAQPIIDRRFVPQSPLTLIKNGDFKKTNILMGTNHDEGVHHVASLLDALDDQKAPHVTHGDFLTVVQYLTGTLNHDVIDAIKFEYSLSRDPNSTGDFLAPAVEMTTDALVTCPMMQLAEAYADRGQDVYLYDFDHRTNQSDTPEWMGVVQGSEVDYIFGRPYAKGGSYTFDEKLLSSQVMTYWTNFAKTGDPKKRSKSTSIATLSEEDTDSASVWNPISAFEHVHTYMRLESPYTEAERGYKERKCRLWRQYMPLLVKEAEFEDRTGAVLGRGTTIAGHHAGTLAIAMLLLLNFKHCII